MIKEGTLRWTPIFLNGSVRIAVILSPLSASSIPSVRVSSFCFLIVGLIPVCDCGILNLFSIEFVGAIVLIGLINLCYF